MEVRWLVLGHKLLEGLVVVVMLIDKLMNFTLCAQLGVPLGGKVKDD